MIEMEPWQWIIGWLAALFIGLSKGGIPGLGNLSIALYAIAFPPRESVGIMLLVLLSADAVTITVYRRYVHWSSLGKLLPWSLVGVAVGYFALGKIDNDGVRRLIGIILLGMTGLHFFRRWQLAWVRMENGQQNSYGLRLDDLLNDGDISANITIMPGDIIIIPESWF